MESLRDLYCAAPSPHFFCRREGVRSCALRQDYFFVVLGVRTPSPAHVAARIENTFIFTGVGVSAKRGAHSFGQEPLLLGRTARFIFFCQRQAGLWPATRWYGVPKKYYCQDLVNIFFISLRSRFRVGLFWNSFRMFMMFFGFRFLFRV